MRRLYFDYNATTPLARGLDQKLAEWVSAGYKNPSSLHQDGQQALSAMAEAREGIKSLLFARKADELIFTSSGTEANNAVIIAAHRNRQNRDTIITTKLEHASVSQTLAYLREQGVVVITVPVDRRGIVDLDFYKKYLTNDVFLVTVMLANNETGFVLPIKEMASLANAQKIPFHTDAVCAVGKIIVNFENLGATYLTLSSHKFGGLPGLGGVLMRPSAVWNPYFYGGGQEAGKRPGTENLLGILAARFALDQAVRDLHGTLSRQEMLREQLCSGIKKIFSGAVFTQSQQYLSQTLNVSFPGLEARLLVTQLDLSGVSVSAGSACSSGAIGASPVIRSLYADENIVNSAIRISFGPQTNGAEVEEFLFRLGQCLC